ncbi:AEL092Wp [Eremothecium gossypii ATCC 10895]|uniref:AEL092Wp n=1 Tax=Eremothecium gossypii (strain ATCC 10895 / CBS 109.51 / FGSC 9923 / NRRL Y-1056) TaxID=284811 RepID=Q757V4_EREGS|nr:AEL092Wp [Eremothecium gossypii ATCC 10895]AAS52593.1 AEL092Wp [Eremothecium gossypii ATCC 10895]AEY96895.1 FAEL092Wp [Eremothecium gossypii FDAG1]
MMDHNSDIDRTRREVLQELIHTEGDYVSMFGLFRESYLKVLAREEEHVVFRSMEGVVKELVRWHRRMEFDLQRIMREHDPNSVETALRVSKLVVAYMARLEALYRSYIYHFRASTRLFAEEAYYGKVMSELMGRLDHGVRTYQRTQFSGLEKRHLWQKDTSYDCLSHLPISRLTNYKLFLEVIGKNVTSPVDKRRIAGYTRKASEIIHQINSDNSTMDPVNAVIQRRLRFPTVEYAPVSAFGQCLLAGCLNAMWVRRRSSYGFAVTAEPLGAFLFKSYLILADICHDWWTVKHCVPMVRCNIHDLTDVISVSDRDSPKLREAISEATSGSNTAPVEGTIIDTGNNPPMALKLEFYFYGQCFELTFAFRHAQEYQVWKQYLETVKELNGPSVSDFEQLTDIGESTMVPRDMVPRTTVASRCPKVNELHNLTNAQRDMLKHSPSDYYGENSIQINVSFSGSQRTQQKYQTLSRNKSDSNSYSAKFDSGRRLHIEALMFDVWSDALVRTPSLEYIMTSYSDTITSVATTRPPSSTRSSWGMFSIRSDNTRATSILEPTNNQDLSSQQNNHNHTQTCNNCSNTTNTTNGNNNKSGTIGRLGTINKLRNYLTVKTYNKQFSENQVA